MDLVGQRNAERLYMIILLAVAVPAYLLGWFYGSMRLMLIVYAAGVAAAVVLAVPDWPFWNRHPLRWLPAGSVKRSAAGGSGAATPSRKQPGSSKQKRSPLMMMR